MENEFYSGLSGPQRLTKNQKTNQDLASLSCFLFFRGGKIFKDLTPLIIPSSMCMCEGSPKAHFSCCCFLIFFQDQMNDEKMLKSTKWGFLSMKKPPQLIEIGLSLYQTCIMTLVSCTVSSTSSTMGPSPFSLSLSLSRTQTICIHTTCSTQLCSLRSSNGPNFFSPFFLRYISGSGKLKPLTLLIL